MHWRLGALNKQPSNRKQGKLTDRTGTYSVRGRWPNSLGVQLFWAIGTHCGLGMGPMSLMYGETERDLHRGMGSGQEPRHHRGSRILSRDCRLVCSQASEPRFTEIRAEAERLRACKGLGQRYRPLSFEQSIEPSVTSRFSMMLRLLTSIHGDWVCDGRVQVPEGGKVPARERSYHCHEER